MGCLGALLSGSLMALPAAALEPSSGTREPYDAALQSVKGAATPEQPDQIDAAIGELSALLPQYLQDVDLPLKLGELLLRRGRYLDALYSYELALRNSSPGGEAELGLGNTLLKLGRCLEARVHFQAVLAETRLHDAAAAGLRQCSSSPTPGLELPAAPAAKATTASAAAPPRLWLQPFLAQSFYIYQNHPVLNYGLGPTARLEALVSGRYYAAATYRYSYFATRSGQVAPFSQHDLYLDAGWNARAFGVTLRYAFVTDGGSYSGNSHHVGVSARYSRFADGLLNLSASFYQDTTVLRGELAWLIPIAGGFSLRPAGALQWTPSDTYKTLSLALFYYHRRFSLWAGGKIGDELRPAYLSVAYVYNSPARIPYGAWGGLSVRPGSRFSLTLNYAYDRLLRTDTTPTQDSVVHALTLGLAREF